MNIYFKIKSAVVDKGYGTSLFWHLANLEKTGEDVAQTSENY